ncbi:MAG: putative lipid II flippase FtsW [Epulopiscium sp.]|nr:putative lipid II flippase FtsW [Candidatus Epulonipiscium sp.]
MKKSRSKIPRSPRGRQCDFTILFTVILLVSFGIVMIFSSSYHFSMNRYGDHFFFLKKQIMWSIVGFGAMMFFMNFDYRYLRKWSVLLYLFSIVTLILVIFIGKEVNGSKRWLGVGSMGFQPSEVAKLGVTLFLGNLVSLNREKLNKFSGFIFYMIIIMIPVIFIALQNLSTAIVVIIVGVCILFIASSKIWHFVVMAVPVLGIGVMAVTLEQFRYRLVRIQAWQDPWSDPLVSGYQTIQSLYAVGSGGIFGLGLGESRQKLGYIPEAHNDIIFSIVCEELGLVGATILLLLFLILIWRGIKVAIHAPDLFGSLIVAGIICQVAVQVLINVSVITNTIPVTGMPLPFISYGGSSLLFLMISMGIVLNVSRYANIPRT